jgi:hypothetical protein
VTKRFTGPRLYLVAALILAMSAATAVGQVGLGGPDAPPAPDPAPAPRVSTPAPSAPSPPAAEEPSGPSPAELRAQREAELAQQRREAQLRRQAELRRQRELALEREREAEARRLAAIERQEAAERRERQEAALAASRELEASRGNADALPSASGGDNGSGSWRLVAIALLVVAGITGTLSLFPTAARRYDMQGTRGVALLTRHRLELGTLCVGTLATLLLVQLLT